tara:strand:+ start:2561 stop:3655 length:1095 start_codon:yes stop_codon:yes gene_type:complete
MNKIKAIIAIGGTGGHVFPGCSLADHLNEDKYEVELVTDKRGYKFLKEYKNFNIYTLPSSPFISKNIFTICFSVLLILYSILRSLIFLIFNRPSIIFGMGGYASFPICIAATILRIKFVIYENNLIIGKTNKYLLPFTKKIFVSYKDLEGISKKYENKICEIGNIIKKKIINLNKENKENKENNKLNVLVLGGSQAAKVFAEVLPNIFQKCINEKIDLKVYQHCLPEQNEQLSLIYKNSKIDFEIFNFSNNLIEYFSRVNLAITRSGSSILAELSNANIPFISIPLPSSAENHQLKNAIYYTKKNFCFLIEEKNLNNKLFSLIKSIYKDRSLLNKIKHNQRQFSDKNVFNNINQELNKLFNEKN